MFRARKKTGDEKKYGNKKVEYAGIWFDSKLEKALFDFLKLRERGKEVAAIHHHPGTIFLSEARIQYRPDFRYINLKTMQTEYAEAKGFAGPKWPMKKKLWKAYGPAPLYIYSGSYTRLMLIETIIPKALEETA